MLSPQSHRNSQRATRNLHPVKFFAEKERSEFNRGVTRNPQPATRNPQRATRNPNNH
jgi:hypothetical protein